MEKVSRELRVTRNSTPVVVCITDTPEERSRLARLYDGVGVLVLAPDPESASRFLGDLDETATAHSATAPGEVRIDGLCIDSAHHEATWHGQPLPLTPHEVKVLGCLASHPGRVRTYQQLHDHAWGGTYFTGPSAVQSVIKRLRAKLRQLALPFHIAAARGLGFRLVRGEERAALPGRIAD